MPNSTSQRPSAEDKAYIITGPTSGIGRHTALDVATPGTVVLVGRDRLKLDALQQEIQQKSGKTVSVVCDLADISSVQCATAEIVGLKLPLAGLVNNAGIMQTRPTKNARSWDTSYATNHLGPFVLTEALMPHLRDGAARILIDISGHTGLYYDEGGQPMQGFRARARPEFPGSRRGRNARFPCRTLRIKAQATILIASQARLLPNAEDSEYGMS